MKNKFCIAIISALVLGGCSMSPKLQDSNLTLPSNMEEQTNINKEWWKEYKDTTLNIFVDEALKNNRDLQVAILNISLSRASLSLNEADLYPSLNGQAGARRTQTSEETYGVRATSNAFSLSAVLNYEVDLWGKIASSNKAARAELLSSKANADTVRLALISSVVDSYFAIVSLNEQLLVANDTILSREEGVKLVQSKVDIGAERISTLEQEKSLLAAAKIEKNTLSQELAKTSTALGILLGREPADILAANEIKGYALPNDISVPSNIPSQIVENRPDIQAAYQKLISSNELIGVNKASYFPSLSLSALFGFESSDIDSLLKSSARTWNIGGSLAAPLIDFKRTKSKVESATISRDIVSLQYEQTVLNAFGQVYDALSNKMILEENLKNRLEYERAIARTLELVQQQYSAGYADYLSVLDAKRSLFSAKLATIKTKQALLSSGVFVFKSLGGGWNKKELSN